ncbi:MAG TPA: hypothetical protein VM328_02970, partial [Fimbriimonadaceae bacterium]|nr:hypothetical protein [Fimbriimonadaceae bacterium]
PSPDLGWAGMERESLLRRGPVGLVLMLALVHHLAIGNNVPLTSVFEFASACGEWLIIEFVPKSDSQVRKMLEARKDIFDGYHQEGFEDAAARFFSIVDRKAIPGTERTLYLMRRPA